MISTILALSWKVCYTRVMQEKRLEEVADIVIGHTMTRSVKMQIDDAGVFILQSRDINGDLYFSDASYLKEVNILNPQPSAFLQDGDIILTGRMSQGSDVKASVFKNSTNKKRVLATSSLFILRIKNPTLLPEYIVMFLNSTEGQKRLKRVLTQGTIQSISIKQLKNIKIPVALLKEQKLLVQLGTNLLEQQKILNRKIEINRKLSKNIINVTK